MSVTLQIEEKKCNGDRHDIKYDLNLDQISVPSLYDKRDRPYGKGRRSDDKVFSFRT